MKRLALFKGGMSQIFFVAIIALLSSCHVLLIGAYDEVTDQSIQQIQNEVTTLVVTLERNIDGDKKEENDYKLFSNDYKVLSGQVESLKIRCGAIPKYGIIISQVNLLASNLTIFEKYHRESGFDSKKELETFKSGFESQFTSMITLQIGLKKEKNTY